jgi:GxxExxY protein
MKYGDITQKIIGASMEVHRILGNGFQEVIYQRALEFEMTNMGLSFQREFEMDIFYKEKRIGGRRVDFFVENCIMVELKASINLEDVHLAQAMNYLEVYNVEIGLLINFGAKSLQFKRLHNNRLKHDSLDLHDEQDYKTNKKVKNQGSDNNQVQSGKSLNQVNQFSDR